MKKLLTLLILVLTLTFCFSATVFASDLGDYNGGGEDGDVGTHDGVYEGITPARSGYLIWLSDGSGRAINGVAYQFPLMYLVSMTQVQYSVMHMVL